MELTGLLIFSFLSFPASLSLCPGESEVSDCENVGIRSDKQLDLSRGKEDLAENESY